MASSQLRATAAQTRYQAFHGALYARGLSQEGLARQLHTNQGNISRLMRGVLRPTPEQAEEIARILRRHPAELFPDVWGWGILRAPGPPKRKKKRKAVRPYRPLHGRPSSPANGRSTHR